MADILNDAIMYKLKLNKFIMKKLSKLTISPEKIMRNEDLINLNGGYGGGDCFTVFCRCMADYPPTTWKGTYCSNDELWDAIVRYCYNPYSHYCADEP